MVYQDKFKQKVFVVLGLLFIKLIPIDINTSLINVRLIKLLLSVYSRFNPLLILFYAGI